VGLVTTLRHVVALVELLPAGFAISGGATLVNAL